MPIEIEAKFRCPNLDLLRDRLRHLGARRMGRIDEINIFFDTDDRALQAADKGLRLRVNRNLADGSQTIVLTFKGPRHDGIFKTREESEIKVSNAESATALIEQLGFSRTLTFEKRRETWLLEQCRVELDELPYIGSFVEIEGPDEQAVMRLQQPLGLAGSPHLKDAYVAMLEAYLREHGIEDRMVTFRDNDE